MNYKILGYISVIIIGIGFIMMAVTNTLGSEIASVLQAVMGVVFVMAATVRIVKETKKQD